MDSKSPFLSKTLWINLLMAIFAFIPVVGTYVSAHPEIFMFGFSAINIVLRLITKKEISIS